LVNCNLVVYFPPAAPGKVTLLKVREELENCLKKKRFILSVEV